MYFVICLDNFKQTIENNCSTSPFFQSELNFFLLIKTIKTQNLIKIDDCKTLSMFFDSFPLTKLHPFLRQIQWYYRYRLIFPLKTQTSVDTETFIFETGSETFSKTLPVPSALKISRPKQKFMIPCFFENL